MVVAKEHARRTLLEFAAAWKERPTLDPPSARLVLALHALPDSYDATACLAGPSVEVPSEALAALAEMAERGDELSDDMQDALTRIVTRVMVRDDDARLQRQVTEAGIRRAIILLSAKDRRCFAMSAHVLMCRFRQWSRLYPEPMSIALLEEAEACRVDLPQLFVHYLSSPHLEPSAQYVVPFADRIIGTNWFPLESSRRVLDVLVRTIQRCTKDYRDLETECRMSLWRICRFIDPRIAGLEDVLLDLDIFRHLCKPRAFYSPRMFGELRHAIRNLFQISPRVQRAFIGCKILEQIEDWMLSDYNRHDTLDMALSGLRAIIECSNEENLDFLMGLPIFRERLIFHHVRMRPSRSNVLPSLFVRLESHPRTVDDGWPILQLRLLEHLFQLTGAGTHAAIVGYMRANPLSVCIRELKEVPIRSAMICLTDPVIGKVTAITFMHDPGFSETGLDLAWLAFALGLCFERDEDGQITDLFNGRFPDVHSRNRIMGMYAIVWALGIASRPQQFRDSERKKHIWLSREMWEVAWNMLYQ